MLSEEEKKAIKLLEDIKNNSWTTKYIMSSDSKNADILLNLITKLQKEKEDLLREKEENKFIIAMANNEMLGYNQGYSDAENKNSNATEIVIKNRQAYIHKEEVELYKRKIDFLQKENEEKDKQIEALKEENLRCANYAIENNELKKRIQELEEENLIQRKQIMNIFDNDDYIPMQVVIDKMEELNKEIKSCDEIDAIFKIKQQQILQELLEGEKNELER